MTFTNVKRLYIPRRFRPPVVTKKSQGEAAFHAYDWYFDKMKIILADTEKIFLTPCAATKPIHNSPLHRSIYQKFAEKYGNEREIFVVSEPVVLIRYQDLYEIERVFCYDFPPKLLDEKARRLFVERLRVLLTGKNITGCLPRHHALLVNDAVGKKWKNYWNGDLYSMMRRVHLLSRTSAY